MIICYFQKVNVEAVKKYIYAHSSKWGDGGHETKLQTLNQKKVTGVRTQRQT